MCYEGDAEENLFGYLKRRFCKKVKSFKPAPLNGFNSLLVFKRKYNQVYRKNGLTRRNKGQNIHFVFLIDGDLDDTPDIVAYIEREGHTHQVNVLNTETLLLRMAGVNLAVDVPLADFRDKAKARFLAKFGKKAHLMKASDFDAIIDEAKFIQNFPTLHRLFTE